MTRGFSGREPIQRSYSYEQGMNPLGIFVTVDFITAKSFGYNDDGNCIIEFTANTNDLETPVWNNQNTYFGANSNPIPFANKEERENQKKKYDSEARNMQGDEYEHIRQSDRPSLAKSLFVNDEHQALFMGDINPNMIKRIWINRPEDGKTYKPVSVTDFIKMFKKQIPKRLDLDKVYKPTEDFNGWEDYINRCDRRLYNGERPDKRTPENIQQTIEMLKMRPNIYYSLMHPKQFIQAYGQDVFDKLYNKFGQ